jgi:hypothetical protein
MAAVGNGRWHPVVMKVGDLGRQGLVSSCCGLCGATGKLSKTHIPPRRAGNRGSSRRGIEFIADDGTSWLGLSRPDGGGGAWGRWLCADCNTVTGRWDDEYARWSRNLVVQIHDGNVRVGQQVPMFVRDGDPGAVVRALWAWMFALDGDLRLKEPALAQSVLAGHPVSQPKDIKLLLAATTSLRIWVSGQVGGYAVRTPVGPDRGYTTADGIWAPGNEMVGVPRVAISSPPFVVLLAEDGHDRGGVPYFDTAEWVADRAGDRRDVSMYLPVVRGFEADGPVTLVTYEQLIS